MVVPNARTGTRVALRASHSLVLDRNTPNAMAPGRGSNAAIRQWSL